MRAQDRGRWAAALAAARRRWLHADAAGRVVITTELDALYAALGGKRAIAEALDEAYATCNEGRVGPKHSALGALLASYGSPGAGVTSRLPNIKVSPPRVRPA